jgi:hypothetical protein
MPLDPFRVSLQSLDLHSGLIGRGYANPRFSGGRRLSVVGYAVGRRGRYGASALDGVGDEALTGAETEKPADRNDGRAGALAAVRWTAVLDRHPLRVRDLRRQSWSDHDPSRGAVEHGSGDFVRHAWHGHVGSPDSVAALPPAGRGAFLARRFRRSRSGPDRIADSQEPGSGSARTGTSCKTLHLDTRDRMRFVAKAHTRSSSARFGGSSVAGNRSWPDLADAL